MALYLIYILAALAVVMIITVLGLILTQIFINRTNKAQIQPNIPNEQSLGVFVDIDDLPQTEQQPSVSIISNDIMRGTPHRHSSKKNVSIIDRINSKNTTNQIHTKQDLAVPTTTDTSRITSRINPVTDKITLDY